ncbi:MAG: cytochrome c oxidase assembly protein, partial [Myxococcota bacterium]
MLAIAALTCLVVSAVLILPGSAALAHPYSGIDARDPTQEFVTVTTDQWLQWDFHPSIFTGIVILCTLYTLGITVWRVKYKLADAIDWPKAILFYSNMLLLWFLLDGPMHHLSDDLLFSAHMVQHLGLQLIWAPLLILGTPAWLIKPLVQPQWVQRFGRFISKPSMAFILFHGVATLWHLPYMYNLALFSHPWHIVEHLMFMSVAVNFWWCILSPVEEVPRATLGRQAAFLFG